VKAGANPALKNRQGETPNDIKGTQ